MPKQWIEFTRRLSRQTWLAGVVLVSRMSQQGQPPPPPPPPDSTSSLAGLFMVIVVIAPIVLGAMIGFAVWLISLGTEPAAVGAEPPKPAPPREVLPPGVHMPPPSIRPLIIAIGMTLIIFGVALRGFAIALGPGFNIPIVLALGVLVMAAGLFGWVRDDTRAARRH